MRKLFIIIFMVLVCLNINAQKSTETDGRHPVYCELIGENPLSSKVKVSLNMGELSYQGYRAIYDINGEQIKFKSLIDALNYMARLGWKYVDSYYYADHLNRATERYLLIKYVSSDDEITEGLVKGKPYQSFKPGASGDDMY